MIYLRKINANLWSQISTKRINKFPSRVIRDITSPKDNDISLWSVDENNSEQIENIAIIMANTSKTHDSIEFLLIEPKKLRNKNLKKRQDDEPALFNYEKNHWNIKNVNYGTLGVIAKKFYAIIKTAIEQSIRRFTMKQICSILKKRIETNKIEISQLNPKSGLYDYYVNTYLPKQTNVVNCDF